MRRWLLDISLAVLMVWSVSVAAGLLITPEETAPITTVQVLPTEQTVKENGPTIQLLKDGVLVELSVEDYLTGVLLCEIPASFHREAKLAQAVVARTYSQRVAGIGAKHGQGIICAESSCCQGYISPEEYRRLWDEEAPIESAREAVQATEGLVITYGGSLIDATYFSCSGGRTEAAVAVWGGDVPYLQAVESPGEENALRYQDAVSFTPQTLCDKLGLSLNTDPAGWFTDFTYTEGGGVDTVRIGGVSFAGIQLRSLLGLRSTCFTVEVTDKIRFVTRGFGHRVGMSQYGADAMARDGADYITILQHYYTGVTVEQLE